MEQWNEEAPSSQAGEKESNRASSDASSPAAGGSGRDVSPQRDGRREITVTVNSTQDGQQAPVAMYTGELIPKGRTLYIRYEEQDELHGSVRTMIRWSGEELTLTRRGGVESDQTFAAGQARGGRYSSAHLSFPLVTETEDLSVTMASDEGLLPLTLAWTYRLRMEDEISGRFQLRLTIQEANQS
ncbi:Uncharacterized beta-barrel protein YwiB, DUF1934 family [Paenibacillaceae bacterium GAS479]|nr:Uncharacterized beta-barrel protein YwiB, DUF1934 family [Paenibacillaceae bacterium GAS479]